MIVLPDTVGGSVLFPKVATAPSAIFTLLSKVNTIRPVAEISSALFTGILDNNLGGSAGGIPFSVPVM